jgi:hypothetical protein
MTFQISGTTILTDSRTFTQYGETLNSLGNTGATPTINVTNGNFVVATLNQNATFTFTNPAFNVCSFTLYLANDGTAGRTITWPASVVWPGGTVPSRTTTASKADVYTFWTANSGTNWFGSLAQFNYTAV